MPVTARDVKRWVKEGLVAPLHGCTEWRPGWAHERQMWGGDVAGFRVWFCPDGREIDMTTLRVRALPVDRAS